MCATRQSDHVADDDQCRRADALRAGRARDGRKRRDDLTLRARRALLELVGHDAIDLVVKWPNDLLLADCKIAGILCEQCPGAAGAGDGVLIIGMGVNVDFDPALLGSDLRHPATTLRACLGRSFDVEEAIVAISRHLAHAMETFEREGLSKTLLAELRANLAYVGTLRTWNSPRGAVTGRVLGLDDAGRLLLECESGRVVCEAGEFLTEGLLPL